MKFPNYLGFPKGDQVENWPSVFFFFGCFFCFPHSVTNRRLGLKTHAQVILSLNGFAWVCHFLVDNFRVFRKKTQLFEMVHRKKNYLGILNSFDSGNPRNNGEETVLRVQIVVLSRRRVSGARTSQILIQATDFLQIFLVLLGIQRLKNYRFDREFVLKYYSNWPILYILNSFSENLKNGLINSLRNGLIVPSNRFRVSRLAFNNYSTSARWIWDDR